MSLGLRLLHLEVQALCLKVRSLHMEWRMLSMHGWANHTWVSGKRGRVLLPEDYPENDVFLLPFFSISLILLSTMIALSTIFWKSS
jgi:hypothetical protein